MKYHKTPSSEELIKNTSVARYPRLKADCPTPNNVSGRKAKKIIITGKMCKAVHAAKDQREHWTLCRNEQLNKSVGDENKLTKSRETVTHI